MPANAKPFDHTKHYRAYLEPDWRKAPFVLRFTEWKDMPVPVVVVKERHEVMVKDHEQANGQPPNIRSLLVERGHIEGKSLRRCLPVLRDIVTPVADAGGVPRQLQRYLTTEGLRMRVNLPLDEEAGSKLALILRLQERLLDLDRVELIARRVARFTREEAAYWLSRMTTFGPDGNRWAVAGLRVMLGGQPNDKAVAEMLARLQQE